MSHVNTRSQPRRAHQPLNSSRTPWTIARARPPRRTSGRPLRIPPSHTFLSCPRRTTRCRIAMPPRSTTRCWIGPKANEFALPGHQRDLLGDHQTACTGVDLPKRRATASSRSPPGGAEFAFRYQGEGDGHRRGGAGPSSAQRGGREVPGHTSRCTPDHCPKDKAWTAYVRPLLAISQERVGFRGWPRCSSRTMWGRLRRWPL